MSYGDAKRVVADTLRETLGWILLSDADREVVRKTIEDVESSHYDDSICSMCDEAFCDAGCPFYGLRHNHE